MISFFCFLKIVYEYTTPINDPTTNTITGGKGARFSGIKNKTGTLNNPP